MQVFYCLEKFSLESIIKKKDNTTFFQNIHLQISIKTINIFSHENTWVSIKWVSNYYRLAERLSTNQLHFPIQKFNSEVYPVTICYNSERMKNHCSILDLLLLWSM